VSAHINIEPAFFKAAEAKYNIKLIPTPLFWEFTEGEKMKGSPL
jgi:hypothetical protein